MLSLAGALAAASALVFALSVGTGASQRIDDAALGNLAPEDGVPVFSASSLLLSTVSVATVALVGVAVVLWALLRRRPGLAFGAAALILASNLTTQLLKIVLPRPDLIDGTAEELTPSLLAGSFPSGHATVAISLGIALTMVAPPAIRGVVATAAAGYGAAIGIAVLALNWHRPSDVIGAYLIVAAWAALVASFVDRRPPEVPSTMVRRPVVVAAGGVLALAVYAGGVVPEWGVAELVKSRPVFGAASLAAVLAAGAVSALVLRMLLARPAPESRRRSARVGLGPGATAPVGVTGGPSAPRQPERVA